MSELALNMCECAETAGRNRLGVLSLSTNKEPRRYATDQCLLRLKQLIMSSALEKASPRGEPDAATDEREEEDHWYGWVCTASIFLINAHTWGINAVRLTTWTIH